MKKLTFLFSLLLIFGSVTAQNTTISKSKKEKPEAPDFTKTSEKVLIVPFELKLYLSDIDHKLGPANNMNQRELAMKFRSAIDKNLYLGLEENGYEAMSFYAAEGVKDPQREQSYIYSSIAYDFKPVPEEDEKAVETNSGAKNLTEKLFGKEAKKEKPAKGGTKVENGQIVSTPDRREKYMKALITNDNMLNTLHESYGTEVFVFITQMDMKRAASGTYDLSEETYERLVKVHYTAYDKKGKLLSSGAKKAYFPSRMNEVDKIITSTFPELCKAIVKTLPYTDPEGETETNKKNNGVNQAK